MSLPEVARFPSLATRWLQRSAKDLPQPLFVYSEETHCSGYYCHHYLTGERQCYVQDLSLGIVSGLIALCGQCLVAAEDEAETIAHEWRHHWQLYQGWTPDGIGWPVDESLPYDDQIRRYFSESRCERDALDFSHAVAPTEWTRWVLSMLQQQQQQQQPPPVARSLARAARPKRGAGLPVQQNETPGAWRFHTSVSNPPDRDEQYLRLAPLVPQGEGGKHSWCHTAEDRHGGQARALAGFWVGV